MPLVAISIAFVIILIPPLQRNLLDQSTILNKAIYSPSDTIGKATIVCTLIMLGANICSIIERGIQRLGYNLLTYTHKVDFNQINNITTDMFYHSDTINLPEGIIGSNRYICDVLYMLHTNCYHRYRLSSIIHIKWRCSLFHSSLWLHGSNCDFTYLEYNVFLFYVLSSDLNRNIESKLNSY